MSIEVLALVIISALSITVGMVLRKRRSSHADYYLAGRRLRGWGGSASIAVTWAWGPALFVSAQQAYINGLVGFLWFFVPNVICILLFGKLAWRMKSRAKECDTLPQVMNEEYNKITGRLYSAQFYILQVCSFAVQVLAGSSVLSWMTGYPMHYIAAGMIMIAMTYSYFGGYRASVYTDILQMVIIFAAVAVMVPTVFAGNVGEAIAGLKGMAGSINPISGTGLSIAVSFGITTAIGLLAGPFGDQTFWQRLFSLESNKEKDIKRTFRRAAVMFAIIPIGFGALGFIAAGIPYHAASPQNVNIEVLRYIGVEAGVLLIVVMAVMAGLFSTADSNISAIGIMLSNRGRRMTLTESKIATAAIAVTVYGIAIIPGLQVLHLFLFYGTLRATTFLPTIITIVAKKKPRAEDMNAGLLLSMSVGVPVYIVGALSGNSIISIAGAVLCVGLSGGYIGVKSWAAK